MDTILSVDLGTTAIKTCLIDASGRLLASASREYRLDTPAPDVVELDPEVYWAAFKDGLAEVLDRTSVAPADIRALGISAQGETLICADASGRAIRPAIVWLDNRAQAEADELAAEFGNEAAYRITGQVSFVPTWPAAKLLWLRHHEPDTFRRASWFLLIEDWFIARLTGCFVCEGSLVTSTMYWDLTTRRWWPEMLAYLGVAEYRLPEIRASGEPVAGILPAVARELGLDPATVVCTGALDQAAGAIGVGNVRPGVFSENTGAALAICATVPAPVFDPARQMPCHDHGVPGMYMEHTFTSGGMVLRWYRDTFCEPELEAARAQGRDAYDLLGELAAGVPAGSEGVVMLPHLQGAMAPEANPHAKGVFYGFTLRHTRAHFARSIMESIAFIVRRNVDVLGGMGIAVDEVRSLGGGARSRPWCQIKADVLGIPVVTTRIEEAASLGAAILAGVAVGTFGSIDDAIGRAVVTRDRFEPDPTNRATYDAAYATYRELYGDLVGLFERS
jgi:sugar (pentulose or hexulose) kinase